MESTQVQVRIPNALLDLVDEQAYTDVRSRSNMVVKILSQHFDYKPLETEKENK